MTKCCYGLSNLPRGASGLNRGVSKPILLLLQNIPISLYHSSRIVAALITDS